MWQDEYYKKIALMNTSNDNDYYIRLDSYLDYIFSSKRDEIKTIVLIKIKRNFNLLNDPLLEKIKKYSKLCAEY